MRERTRLFGAQGGPARRHAQGETSGESGGRQSGDRRTAEPRRRRARVTRVAEGSLRNQVPVDTTGMIGTIVADGFKPSNDNSGDAGSAMSRIV